ncbi:MAG: hypothetical protein KKF62_09975, partial [Bacteroidetes bacterium]|nr:hypothetical protein [Bacteroidota bacterium]
ELIKNKDNIFALTDNDLLYRINTSENSYTQVSSEANYKQSKNWDDDNLIFLNAENKFTTYNISEDTFSLKPTNFSAYSPEAWNIYTDKIYEYFLALSSLNRLIFASIKIAKVKTNEPIEQIELLKKHSSLLTKLRRKLGYLVIDKSSLGELGEAIIGYLNLFMLMDLVAYIRTIVALEKYLFEIEKIFVSIGELDTLISLASYIEENPNICSPTFNNSANISFGDIYHPLLSEPITNTLNSLEKSALITGSNMAGKTTFIKTVGVNVILAQTIYLCHAKHFSSFPFVVKSSIKREDNLRDSKSYFFVEVEQLQEFMKLSEKSEKYLFLIDEIFRGTNTIERLASSSAVLDYLNNKSLVLVTTHDIELQNLLGDSFEMYHFNEQVENNKYFFDYKIKRDSCFHGNAIKLLEIKKYPNAVTEKAKETAKILMLQSNYK